MWCLLVTLSAHPVLFVSLPWVEEAPSSMPAPSLVRDVVQDGTERGGMGQCSPGLAAFAARAAGAVCSPKSLPTSSGFAVSWSNDASTPVAHRWPCCAMP